MLYENYLFTSPCSSQVMNYHRFPFRPANTGAADSDTAVATINRQIIEAFNASRHDPDVKKTHFFGGRYENVYVGTDRVPQLRPVLDQALDYARQITGVNELRAGFWFNAMPPGSDTTLHRHDDDDELLSAVYYISAPKDSGNLIIHEADQRHEITPAAGDFVFFGPDVPHEVSQNNSDNERLSIGINFGPLNDEDH